MTNGHFTGFGSGMSYPTVDADVGVVDVRVDSSVEVVGSVRVAVGIVTSGCRPRLVWYR
jgi:hypothetical protein